MPDLPDALESARLSGWSVDTDGQTVTLRSNTRDLFTAFGVSLVLVAWAAGMLYGGFSLQFTKGSTLRNIGLDLPILLFMFSVTCVLASAVAVRLFGRVECRLDGQAIAFKKGVWFVNRRWTVRYADVHSAVFHVATTFRSGRTYRWQLMVNERLTHQGQALELPVRYDFSDALSFRRSESLAHVIAAATGTPVEHEDATTLINEKDRPAAASDPSQS